MIKHIIHITILTLYTYVMQIQYKNQRGKWKRKEAAGRGWRRRRTLALPVFDNFKFLLYYFIQFLAIIFHHLRKFNSHQSSSTSSPSQNPYSAKILPLFNNGFFSHNSRSPSLFLSPLHTHNSFSFSLSLSHFP